MVRWLPYGTRVAPQPNAQALGCGGPRFAVHHVHAYREVRIRVYVLARETPMRTCDHARVRAQAKSRPDKHGQETCTMNFVHEATRRQSEAVRLRVPYNPLACSSSGATLFDPGDDAGVRGGTSARANAPAERSCRGTHAAACERGCECGRECACERG